LGRLALLLIPALARDAQQHLAAALGRMVNVPVVAAARLERHVEERNACLIRATEEVQIRIADKVLGKARVRIAEAEDVFLCKAVFNSRSSLSVDIIFLSEL
jgi:hypothetical protein